MSTVVTVEQWVTKPRWTRAHALEQVGSLGAERFYETQCGLDYPLADPIYDEPTAADASTPRCKHCVAVLEGRRV